MSLPLTLYTFSHLESRALDCNSPASSSCLWSLSVPSLECHIAIHAANHISSLRTCQGSAIDPYLDWSSSDPSPDWQPICGGQGFSGKSAPSTAQCPAMQGVGGTPDTSVAQHEQDTCLNLAQQAEANRGQRMDLIGSDVCGNGGCRSLDEYCAAVARNGGQDGRCGT